jgi:hypothetical protein
MLPNRTPSPEERANIYSVGGSAGERGWGGELVVRYLGMDSLWCRSGFPAFHNADMTSLLATLARIVAHGKITFHLLRDPRTPLSIFFTPLKMQKREWGRALSFLQWVHAPGLEGSGALFGLEAKREKGPR